jgi:transcriptional regulator with XRE-family HTH domain
MELNRVAEPERKYFSERLKKALKDNKIDVRPSLLARGFNLRAEGASVTAHAVRKWLVGEAIPTQERILILAKWLNVSAAWLRFGDAENTDFLEASLLDTPLSEDETKLIQAVFSLSKPSQDVIFDMVASLKKLEGTMLPGQTRRKSGRR